MTSSLRSKNHYDAIVLGAGVAGLGAALALAEESLKVLLITKPKMLGEASRAAAGILDPFLQISDPHHPLLSLTLPALQSYEKDVKFLEAETGKQIGYKKTGMLYKSFSLSEEKELSKRFSWQKKTSVKVFQTENGLEYPTVGRVYPELYMDALLALAKKRKVKILTTEDSLTVKLKKNQFCGIRLPQDFYSSDILVNAAGSWWNSVLKLPKITVTPVRGQIVVARSPKKLTNKILHSLDCHYIVPWENNLYLCGTSTENTGFRSHPTVEGVASIWDGLEKLLGSTQDLSIVRMWAGLRPKTKDSLPLLGPLPYKGGYAAGGYYRSGILFGAYAGKLLAKSIVSGRIAPELIPFNPLRFLSK